MVFEALKRKRFTGAIRLKTIEKNFRNYRGPYLKLFDSVIKFRGKTLILKLNLKTNEKLHRKLLIKVFDLY